MEHIGIYGGSFDPPHLGHLQVAQQAIRERSLDKLLIIPSYAAPKELSLADAATLEQRLDMLRLCFSQIPNVEIMSPDENPESVCPDDQRIEETAPVLSRADIRRLLAFRCAEEFLPEGVSRYIQMNNLYGTGKSLRHLPMNKLEQVVISLLKPNRITHVLGCRDTATELARIWGVDETDAARAGLLHDITKALDGPLQLTLCRAYGIILNNFSKQNPKTLHALTGSLVAERIFGENDAVVSAIASHTTGKADMNMLEKVIYVADYMEPNRNFDGVDELRKLAYSDIDKALKLGLEMTLTMLRRQGREISPESQQALIWLERKEE